MILIQSAIVVNASRVTLFTGSPDFTYLLCHPRGCQNQKHDLGLIEKHTISHRIDCLSKIARAKRIGM